MAEAQQGRCAASKESPRHGSDVSGVELPDVAVAVHGAEGDEGDAVRHGQQVTRVPDAVCRQKVIAAAGDEGSGRRLQRESHCCSRFVTTPSSLNKLTVPLRAVPVRLSCRLSPYHSPSFVCAVVYFFSTHRHRQTDTRTHARTHTHIRTQTNKPKHTYKRKFR